LNFKELNKMNAKKIAKAKYRKKLYQYVITFFPKDIEEEKKLKGQMNKSEFIKNLIRKADN